jgi:hypothetical protein
MTGAWIASKLAIAKGGGWIRWVVIGHRVGGRRKDALPLAAVQRDPERRSSSSSVRRGLRRACRLFRFMDPSSQDTHRHGARLAVFGNPRS